MARHVFLTGEKQVGKSTLLGKALNRIPGKIGGFFTVRTNAFLRNAYSVHLFCVGEPPVPTAENLLFVCGKADVYTSERFDHLGCKALERSNGCDLIVMDELGPHEADAVLFHTAVLNLLDGTVPILGVLQAPAERFWPDIVKHPEVRLLEVTKENREDLLWSGIFR